MLLTAVAVLKASSFLLLVVVDVLDIHFPGSCRYLSCQGQYYNYYKVSAKCI